MKRITNKFLVAIIASLALSGVYSSVRDGTGIAGDTDNVRGQGYIDMMMLALDTCSSLHPDDRVGLCLEMDLAWDGEDRDPTDPMVVEVPADTQQHYDIYELKFLTSYGGQGQAQRAYLTGANGVSNLTPQMCDFVYISGTGQQARTSRLSNSPTGQPLEISIEHGYNDPHLCSSAIVLYASGNDVISSDFQMAVLVEKVHINLLSEELTGASFIRPAATSNFCFAANEVFRIMPGESFYNHRYDPVSGGHYYYQDGTWQFESDNTINSHLLLSSAEGSVFVCKEGQRM